MTREPSGMDRDFDPKDGGWFPVMHDLAEKLITTDLTKVESRVLWMFFRYCYGYNKPSCEFQWKDMKDITQLGDGSLSKAINKLKKRNIIQTFHMESKTYVTYRINSKIGSWKTPLSIRKDFPNGKQTLHKRKVNASHMESVPIKDNIKTVKDSSRKSTTFDTTSLPYQLSETLLKQITNNQPDFKPANNGVREATLQRWSKDIDKMIRIDKRTVCAIWNMIIWCQHDDFWFPNIQSGAKLRKQYDQLAAQINRSYRGKKTQHDKLLEVGAKWLEKRKMNDS
jgi:phage replication O-like protein O